MKSYASLAAILFSSHSELKEITFKLDFTNANLFIRFYPDKAFNLYLSFDDKFVSNDPQIPVMVVLPKEMVGLRQFYTVFWPSPWERFIGKRFTYEEFLGKLGIFCAIMEAYNDSDETMRKFFKGHGQYNCKTNF